MPPDAPILSYSSIQKRTSAIAEISFCILGSLASALGGLLLFITDVAFAEQLEGVCTLLFAIPITGGAMAVCIKCRRSRWLHQSCFLVGGFGIPLALALAGYEFHLAVVARRTNPGMFAGRNETTLAHLFIGWALWSLLTLMTGFCGQLCNRLNPASPSVKMKAC